MEDITTQKYLKSILRYNPVTGEFFWVEGSQSPFPKGKGLKGDFQE